MKIWTGNIVQKNAREIEKKEKSFFSLSDSLSYLTFRSHQKKSIPKIWELEWSEKVHSQNLGLGIRGFYFREWLGNGIPLTLGQK